VNLQGALIDAGQDVLLCLWQGSEKVKSLDDHSLASCERHMMLVMELSANPVHRLAPIIKSNQKSGIH
jgi:hypothetical protein